MMHKNTFLLVVAMLPAALLQAQNERQPKPSPAVESKSASQNDAKGTAQSDAILATWLHVGSTNEVALAQIAMKQAQHPEVRAFAQTMIDDHTAWATKLQPMTTVADRSGEAGSNGDRGKAERGEVADPDARQKQPADASAPRGNRTDGGFDHMALIRDLGKKCVRSETKVLSSKTGAEFDRAFMAMQVASHVRCVDMLEVFKTYASPALVPTLDEGLKTITAHLDHAKALCKQLEEGAGNGSGEKSPRGGR